MYRVSMSGSPTTPAVVRARVRAEGAHAVLQQVAELLSLSPGQGLGVEEIALGLAQRETIASTNIGSGIAIPHFIDNRVGSAAIVALTLQSPIKWGSGPDLVDIVFGLSGTPAEPWRHVRSLAHLARLAGIPGFADRLRGAPDDEALHRAFAEEAARHG